MLVEEEYSILVIEYNSIGGKQSGMTKKDFEERHVLFQQEDKSTYIKKRLTKAQEEWICQRSETNKRDELRI